MASIGIAICLNPRQAEYAVKDATAFSAIVERGGSIPFLLPHCETQQAIQGMCERLDGVILAGGEDIHPRFYDEAEEPYLKDVDERRDRFELRLTRRALALDIPVLGVCRGCQLLNVAAGGSLYQDIEAQAGAASHRDDWETAYDRPADWSPHLVEIEPGSKLHELLRQEQLLVNSYHHQAVKEVAPGFRSVARATDGLTEAIESAEQQFALGIQWHNELLAFRDGGYWNIFEGFLRQADAYRARKRSTTIIGMGG